ncbi:MAG: DNA mismatch repair protein MutS, partial [Parachlamydiales bacterium]
MSEKLTPMMEQWLLCKKQAKEALLLFRLGDFYEAFFEDAKIIAKALALTLTKRQSVPMCGIPFYTVEEYIDDLIKAGYKVAIAEQMENPQTAKGLVKREVVRIISKGTLVSSALLNEKSNNFFACLSRISATWSLAFLDLTTAEFFVLETESLKELKDELFKRRPAEILLSSKLEKELAIFFRELFLVFQPDLSVEEDWFFDFRTNWEALLGHFAVQLLDGFGLKGKNAAVIASGALLSYLKEKRRLDLSHITSITPLELKDFLAIDSASLRHLELIESNLSADKSHKTKSTLWEVLDFTLTPMGGRMLKEWLKHPLLSLVEIKKRQAAVQELLDQAQARPELIGLMEKIKDLERLMMRLSANFATPRDLAALGLSLEKLPPLRSLLKSFASPLIREAAEGLGDFEKCAGLLKKALRENPPLRTAEGGMIKPGYNAELDNLRSFAQNALNWIEEYQNRLKKETGIKTLKVGFTNVFGYFIEVSKAALEKMPSSFIRKQTLVNGERFISEELKAFEEKILSAEAKSNFLEQKLYNELKETVKTFSPQVFAASQSVAVLDSLLSLALVALQYNYVCP